MDPLDPISEGKRRAARIQLDHYKRTSTMTRLRWLFTLIGLCAAVGYSVWSLATPRAAVMLSHGRLSEPHALWDSHCQACHLPGVPLRADAVRLGTPVSGAANQCQTCHPVSNHHTLPADPVHACASCHREHQGRDTDLNRVADSACTACHGQQQGQPHPGARPAIVTGFPDGHPGFGSLPQNGDSDPGRLRFSHSRHMRLGLTANPESKEAEWVKLEHLPEEYRDQYRRQGQAPSDRVQLSCSSCHTMQETNELNGTQIYLPVNYEQSCKACHALPITQDKGSALLDHGLTDTESRERLREFFRSEWFDKAVAVVKQQQRRPSPGRSTILKAVVGRTGERVADDAETAARRLWNRCQQCHEMVSDKSLDILPTSVPQQWLTGARFDHYAHRTLNCAECHPGAYKELVDRNLTARGQESDEVMIPQLEVCARCHAPRHASGGGFRFDCVLCHRYHDHGQARPLQHGPIDSGEGLTIDGFLKGDSYDETPR